MSLLPSPIARFLSAIVTGMLCTSGLALSLDDLKARKDLTPDQFAAYFKDFEFTFRIEVQSPEMFLASRDGDCDDYSTLAAAVLRERGYTPRLIAVRMPGVTHVVCYVEETGAYLDYNNRAGANRLVRCENSLNAIAASVAQSYRLKWFSVSEFTFDSGTKRLVETVIKPRQNNGIFANLFSF